VENLASDVKARAAWKMIALLLFKYKYEFNLNLKLVVFSEKQILGSSYLSVQQSIDKFKYKKNKRPDINWILFSIK
jgi:hypothetical protein